MGPGLSFRRRDATQKTRTRELTDEEPAGGARTAVEPPAAAALRRRPAAGGRRAPDGRRRGVTRGRVPSAAPAPVTGRRTLLLLPAVFPVTVQAPGDGGVGRRPVVVGRVHVSAAGDDGVAGKKRTSRRHVQTAARRTGIFSDGRTESDAENNERRKENFRKKQLRGACPRC